MLRGLDFSDHGGVVTTAEADRAGFWLDLVDTIPGGDSYPGWTHSHRHEIVQAFAEQVPGDVHG